MKTIYLIRHVQALGQEPEAELSPEGFLQAEELSRFLTGKKIEKIVCSPFRRAVHTIKPFADAGGMPVQLDARLSERVLSSNHLPDWLDKLKATFHDPDLKFDGGESSSEAQRRGIKAISDLEKSIEHVGAVVSHGNLLSQIIRYYRADFGFKEWSEMRNPDVFELSINRDMTTIRNVWRQ
ncbi:histidine phosphatase family protein [Paenibacillus herberti]|uniref:Histidine phosphatase family protein n=1 Tax=Paenibacillus herberti TaxID=1619309 RepID=A0A229NU29_9BACL|nr:histidine phosphatase family protein [Paenibacillus herberti]OXM13416.1 histidine phosphatase family protein [Paenibacillus herberti]